VVSFTFLMLYPRGNSPSTHSIRGWVGPTADVNVMEKRKNILLITENERQFHGRPAGSLVAVATETIFESKYIRGQLMKEIS
jgi:hypothetical protein